MAVQVKLAEILDAYESVSPDNCVFVNRKTGEVVQVLAEFLRDAEDEEPLDNRIEWQREMMKLAYIVGNDGLYIEIYPFDMNEYNMMERFCFTLTDPTKENALYNAIKGRGAFRRFKNMIYDLEVADDWYEYRDTAYERHAKRFCEKHGFTYN